MSPKQRATIEGKIAAVRAAFRELDQITKSQARLAERLTFSICADDCVAVGQFMADVLATVSRKDQLDALMHHKLKQARQMFNRAQRKSNP